MEAKINESELKLLVWLHENSPHFGEDAAWDVHLIESGLGYDRQQILAAATFLQGFGMVGAVTKQLHRGDNGEPPLAVIGTVWLTPFGENYIRNIESTPTIAQKLTLATLGKLGQTATTVATAMLTEILKQHLRPIA
ncbi:MAG: hypothetical protein JWM57_2678 [Phycisphaerales bacterium]|nr:hypothetical protein [Phycisphaerales bacterium]